MGSAWVVIQALWVTAVLIAVIVSAGQTAHLVAGVVAVMLVVVAVVGVPFERRRRAAAFRAYAKRRAAADPPKVLVGRARRDAVDPHRSSGPPPIV